MEGIEPRNVLEFPVTAGPLDTFTLDVRWTGYYQTYVGLPIGIFVYGSGSDGIITGNSFAIQGMEIGTFTMSSAGPDTPRRLVSLDVTNIVRSELSGGDSHFAVLIGQPTPIPGGHILFDSVSLNVTTVPEPSAWMLVGFGGAVVMGGISRTGFRGRGRQGR